MSGSIIHLRPARPYRCRTGNTIFAFHSSTIAIVLDVRRYSNLRAMLAAEQERLLAQYGSGLIETPEQLLKSARALWRVFRADEKLAVVAVEIGPFVRVPREDFERRLEESGYDLVALREEYAVW